MKGWLDNFGKADNANESKVSMSEDFVGLGYDTKGRNYSPAWGGQFQKGGQLTPVSPLQQVQQAVQPTPTVPYLQTKDPAEFYKSWIQSPEYARRQLLTGYSEGEDLYMPNAAASRKSRLGAIEEMTPITYSARQPSEAKPGVYGSPSYVNINPSDYIDTSKEAIQAHELAHIAGAMGEVRPGMMSAKEQEIFKKSMLPMKEPVLSGVQGSKEREASKRALEDWKHSQEPDEAKADLDALRFMMYDKGIYDITKGKKFTETDFEKAKQNLGKDRVFKRLENRMGKKNFVNLMNTIALADEEEAPIAMGGMSIPGSVGFSYARVAGAAPSKGKYAKKTMASAQMGDNVKKDETNIDTGVANKIAALELQQNPDYQHWKYLQSLPQLRQAPGRGEQLMRQGLRYADVTTDVMQLGNFIPHPTAQAVGKVGNIAGSIIDGLQAADEAYRGNYLNAGINLGSAALPTFLGANTFRRPAMNLRAGDPLYSLTEQATKPYVLNLAKPDTNYLELFSKVKKMKDNSLLYNRALLGFLGAETAYDVLSQSSSPNVINSSDIEGVYPNFNIELENPKSQSLPTKTENADPAIAKKLADYMKSKSRENTGEVYGRKSYYPIDGFQNGGEMRFYQNGLDWKPKSMQDGGDEIYQGIELPEFVVEGKDERVKEAMSQGIKKFYGHIGELMGAPQKEAMQFITGKEQTPSEAWGFQNTGDWLDNYSSFGKNLSNSIVDAVLDPVNAIPGVGLIDDLTRGAVRGAAQNAISNTLKYGVIPYSYSPEVLAMIPENLVRGALGKPKRFPTIVTESAAKDPNIKRTIEDTFNNREDALSVYAGLPPENKGLRLVGSDEATGLSKYELTNPRVMNVDDVKDYRKVVDRSTLNNQSKTYLNLNKPGDTVVDSDKLFGVMGGYSKFVSPDGKNIMYRDVWDLQPFSRFTSSELPTKLGEAVRNFEVSSLIPGARPFVSEGKLADIKTKFLPARPYKDIKTRFNEQLGYVSNYYEPEAYIKDIDNPTPEEIFNYDQMLRDVAKKTLLERIKNERTFLNPLPSQDFKKYADFAPYIKVDKSKKKDGGIIKDNEGYWNPDNWGQPVEIDSNDITMKGVYEPLLGVSDTGDAKLMKPGKNYKFKGKKVTEFPVAKLGINQLDAQPMKKLNQLLNFTNNPDKDNWLDKYN